MGQDLREDKFDYCADLVKSARPERFLSLQFANPSLRQKLLAIAAFEVELAHIADHVTDPHLGQMRLQFWREGLADIAKGASSRAHPVMQSMSDVFAKQALVLAGDDMDRLFGALAESYFPDRVWSIERALDHFQKIEMPFLSLSLSLIMDEEVLAEGGAMAERSILQKAGRARAVKAYLFHLLASAPNGLAANFQASLPSGPEVITALQEQWKSLLPALNGAPSKLMPVLAELSHIAPWLKRAARHGAGKGGLTTHPAKLFWTIISGRF